jgi:hypothetical protein
MPGVAIGVDRWRRHHDVSILIAAGGAAPANSLRTLRAATYFGYFRSGQDLPRQPSKLECPNEQPFWTFNRYPAVQ